MPMIQLITGVDVDGSYAPFLEDLGRLIQKVEKNPPKIKLSIDIDNSTVTHITKQIESIEKATRDITTSGGSTAFAPMAKGTQEYEKSIGKLNKEITKCQEAYDKLGDSDAMSAVRSSVSSAMEGFKALKGQLEEGVVSAKQFGAEFEQIKNSIPSIPDVVTPGTKTYEESIKSINAAIKSVSKQRASMSNIDDIAPERDILDQSIDSLEELKASLESGSVVLDDFKTQLLSIRNEVDEAFSDSVSKTAKSYITPDSSEYDDAIKKLARLQSRADKALSWTAAESGSTKQDYLSLREYRNEIDKLYASLANGEITVENFGREYDNLNSKIINATASITNAGKNTKSTFDRLHGLAEKFVTWFSISQIVMEGVKAIKAMISSVISLDASMTELKKVTDETEATYDRFLTNAAGRAKKLGSALTDVITATADFARLGYTLSEAENLADAAIVYKNVGDGITDINEASESVIATMQAFGISASDAMSIVDKFNSIGNAYAISSGGVGDALLRSAAAMQSANNTLDETIALATASNTIVQNPEVVGTTLKTISMYLRAAKTEAEEAGESTDGMAGSVSELRGEILKLTGNAVDIQIDEDNFKSTYQILKELSVVWDDLSDISQANILEMVGGKRNANVVAAILENFTIAENALETSMNSAGSALAENEKYLDSINGRISIFKSSFEGLSATVIDSEMVKGVVDMGTALLDGATNAAEFADSVGGLKTALLATLSVAMLYKSSNIVDGVTSIIDGLRTTEQVEGASGINALLNKGKVFASSVKDGATAIPKLVSALKTGKTAGQSFSVAMQTAGLSMQSLVSFAGLAVAAITAVIAIVSAYKQKQEELRQQAIANGEAAADESSKISNLLNQYIALGSAVNDGTGSREEFISVQDELIQSLELERYEIQRLVQEYGDYETAITEAAKAKLAHNQLDLQSAVSASGEQLVGVAGDLGSKISARWGHGLGSGRFSDSEAAYEALARSGLVNVERIDDASEHLDSHIAGVFTFADADISTAEGVIDLYNRIGQALEVVSEEAGYNNEVYDALYERYDALKDVVGVYGDAVSSLNKSVAEEQMLTALIGKDIPKTESEFDSFRTSLVESAKASEEFVGSEQDIEDAIDGVLSSQTQFAEYYNTSTSSVVGNSIAQSTAVRRLSESFSALKSSYDLLSKAEEEMASGGLSVDTIKSLASAEEDYIDYLYEENGVIKLNVEMWRERANLAAQAEVSNIESQIAELEAERAKIQREIESLQDFVAGSSQSTHVPDILRTEARNKIQDLNVKLEENSSAVDENQKLLGIYNALYNSVTGQSSTVASFIYNETGVVKENTAAWNDRAEAVLNAATGGMNDIVSSGAEIAQLEAKKAIILAQIAELTKDGINSGFERGELAGLNVELEEIEQKLRAACAAAGILQSILDNPANGVDEYADAIAEFADTKGVIDQVSNSLTTIADLQKAVADGFTLSTQEALKFAEVYPEILNSATVSADGQITLNEEVVNGFVSGKEHELKADIDARIKTLTARRHVLVSLKTFAEAQLELAKSAALGESEATRTLAEYKIQAGQTVAQAMIDAGMEQATAMELAAAAMAGNFQEFDRIAMEVCTDLEGNFNLTAYTMAQSMYHNVNIMKQDLSSVAEQAQRTAQAIAGVTSGQVTGSTSIAAGSGGGYSSNGSNFSTSDSEFNGEDFFYDLEKFALDELIQNIELDLSEYNNAISQIDGQLALLEALRNSTLDRFESDSSGSGSGGSGTGDEIADKAESWFDRLYALHNHLVNMEAEEVGDYLSWLSVAFEQAYAEGIIGLDDYRKYAEEVYDGLKNLFLDYLNDVEHEISMRGNFDTESHNIIALYEELLAAVEKEIESARAQGLDDTDDYIQQLQNKWWSYTDALEEMRDSVQQNAKDSLEELVNIRVDMLKEDVEREREALDDRLDLLKEFYDKQKELLQDAYDEEKYLEEQSEKRKAVSDIQTQIEQLRNDDSAWAQKRRLELEQELADAEKELADFEKEHALDSTLDMLDDMYESQVKAIEDQDKELAEKIEDEKALYEMALEDIRNGSMQLYEEMIEWNSVYGSGISDDITTAWESAYIALQNYKDLFEELYQDVDLFNATGFIRDESSWDTSVISGTNPNNPSGTSSVTGFPGGYTSINNAAQSTAPNVPANNTPPQQSSGLNVGDSITVKSTATHYGSKSGNAPMSRYVPGGSYTVYKIDGDEALIGIDGVYTGWIKKSDIVGYASGTRFATRGIHAIDEKGIETIFESADGTRYKMFTGGEKVLNATASNFLYNFATSGGKSILDMVQKFASSLPSLRSAGKEIIAEIKTGDIIIQGNADQRSISEIRRAQRDNVDFILKEFARLSR